MQIPADVCRSIVESELIPVQLVHGVTQAITTKIFIKAETLIQKYK